MSSIKTAVPKRAAPAFHEIERGMALRKCRKCGCMKEALDAASRTFRNAEEREIRELLPTIESHQIAMEPIAYDCIGCKKCWGADAIVQLANSFEEVAPGECSSDGDPTAKREYMSVSVSNQYGCSWPPHPGEYIVGNPLGSVAICTMSNRELPQKLIAAVGPDLAIAGRCDTENIGIEKVVLNLLANSHIRWLVLCGVEAPGHRAADAFLRLKERGVDPNMRVLESASWRPVLKNLTLFDVARFREQIELVNLIGVTAVSEIVEAAHEAAKKPTAPLSFQTLSNPDKVAPRVERLQARAPKTLRLDKAGFFVVLPQAGTGLIICEHYENSGRLAHVIEGRQAAVIAATVIQEGLVTQLDHAAYLGRELAKVEIALKTGSHYEQDAALGILPSKRSQSTELCEDLACSCHEA
jgi:tetrahydromethanopterin S-methyltransferase subunit A